MVPYLAKFPKDRRVFVVSKLIICVIVKNKGFIIRKRKQKTNYWDY